MLIFSEPTCSVWRIFHCCAWPFPVGLKQRKKGEKTDKETYLKGIFYIVHVVTLQDTQTLPINPSFSHSLNISSSNENHVASQCKNHHSLQRFTFTSSNNSRGIHYYYLLSLRMTMGNSAIVLYCKTKKRQWRGLASCICSSSNVHARPADVTHCLFVVTKRPDANI